MATYPVVNKVTGEQKEVSMSVYDWDQWKTDNPDWDRDWSDPSHPGWTDLMKNKVLKDPKARRNPTITQKYNY